jgi:HEAT repeat protein
VADKLSNVSHPAVYQTITDCRPVICSGRMLFRDAVEIFRALYTNYPRTDIRLLEYAVQNAPGTLPLVVRVLSAVSDGSRLLEPLRSLYDRCEDRRLRAQVALFLARNIRDRNWIHEALRDADARVRANIIEGMREWNNDTELLRSMTHDPNHRVACNACLSLAALGDPLGRKRLEARLKDNRVAFRTAACWALGTISTSDDIILFERMLQDPEPAVQSHARRALRRLQEAARNACRAPKFLDQVQQSGMG